MPIEFVCEQCSRTLRVPDGSGGRQSQCPACLHVQQVPDMNVARATASGTAGASELAVAAGDDRLNVPCPKCKHLLLCSPKQLGTRGQCRQCKHIFRISLDPQRAAATEPVDLVFSCPECHQLFEGRPDMDGRKGKCHACQAVFTISLREGSKLKDTGELGEAGLLSPAGAGKPGDPHAAATATQPAGRSSNQPERLKPHLPKPQSTAAQSAPSEPRMPTAAGASSTGARSARAKSANREVPTPSPPKPSAQNASPQKASAQKPSPQKASAQPSPAPNPTPAKFKLPQSSQTQEPVLAGAAAAEAAVLSAAELQQRVQRPRGQGNGRPLTPIRFMCSQCQGMMEVPGTSAGMETACPYCRSVQAIPAQSQVEESAPLEPFGFDADPLAEFAASPAALQHQWSAQTITRHRAGLSVSNVFQTAFENLFPSSLISVLHVLILGLYAAVGFGIAFGTLMLLASMRLPRESMMVAFYVCFGLFGLVSVFVGAWFSASIRHMALRAVRKLPLDVGQALSPGGAFGAALLLAFLSILTNLLLRVPAFVEQMSPGSFGLLGLVWVLVLLPIIAFVNALFSFASFAAIDGDSSGEAFGTSCRLVMKHLPIMIGVKILVWLITIPLAVLTLGFALILPIYFNATLYNLARKQ